RYLASVQLEAILELESSSLSLSTSSLSSLCLPLAPTGEGRHRQSTGSWGKMASVY
ncbi:hypothetical protein THAOC_24183, partial [Thalassiosira oceanica]